MKNKTKRFAALALCLLMLLPMLAACKKNKTDEPNVTPEGIVLLETPVVISGGDTVYTVANPQASAETYSNCLTQLINIANGFTMPYRTAKEGDNFATDTEILLGNTCRTESQDALAAIGYDDFSITYVNNKIVVAAHTPQRLEEAVAFLKDKILQIKDGKLEYIGNYHFVSNEKLLIGEGESLADYKIVCGDPDNLYAAATSIKQAIKKICGVYLKIVLSNQAATEQEIVIGAPREGMNVSTDQLALDEGMVTVQGKSVLITSRNVLTTAQTVASFVDEYLSGIYSNTFNLAADFSATVNALDGLFQDDSARAQGTEVRVMSFNLLVDIWSDTPAVKGRDTVVAQTILHYTPDVIGLQEVSSTWHKNLKLYLKNTGYQLTCTERTVVHEKYGKNNFNPILYNSETLTLLDNGVKEYVTKENKYMRTMSWALFEVKATGEKFVHLNTHFDAPGNNEEEKEKNLAARKEQSKELVAFKNELVASHNCPIFVTGDFNTVEGNDKTGKHLPYWNLCNNGLIDAKFYAEKIKRQPATWHNLGSSVSNNAGSFDHVFGSDRVTFKFFNTLIDKPLLNASDHCPVYADAVLN